ncbi:Uncharacterized conserved protein YodC, DUF2158 family [Collimonas sp. OK607]|uniref:YodC family protein n=1 Tax=Collimonas sp. OK607 TaxID=1798194 RepID=UPI0008EE9E65|nr:DUF2158 domain-containing protein [Collimonas sp. OK607]SFB35269.1 Uncharacterized conserved protein YodC, DUF2158 family [Collimonas sp. OK607]
MNENLKIGDVVQLNSGGPKMTVTEVAEDGSRASTMWFAGSKREMGGFPIEAIILISDSAPAKK